MKRRNNYVSNSSSTSFVLLYHNENEFDFMKDEGEYYERFIKDLHEEKDEYALSRIKDMFKDMFEETIATCKKYIESQNAEDLTTLLSKLVMTDKNLKKVIERAIKIEDDWNMDDDEFAGLRFQFGKTLADLLNGSKYTDWYGLKVACLEYSDNDGEFWCDMEHEFMPKIVKESKSRDFDAFSISHH